MLTRMAYLILFPIWSVSKSLEGTEFLTYSHNVKVVNYTGYTLNSIESMATFILLEVTLPKNLMCSLPIFHAEYSQKGGEINLNKNNLAPYYCD